MRSLLDDLRFSGRMLRRSPGIVGVAILSLALGVGANTAVFSFVNAIQFRPLPFADEGSLVDLSETSATELCGGCAVGTSYPGFLDWKESATAFTGMEAYREGRFVVSGGAGPDRVGGALASSGLFSLIGERPALGRDFVPADDAPAAPPVVIISDRLWQRRFPSTPEILGRTLKVDGVARTIVGVMPAGFRFPELADLWIPAASAGAAWPREDRSLSVVARLRRGVTLAQALGEMRVLAAGLAARYPETNRGWTATVVTLRSELTSETAQASAVLLAAVGFVLLIGCANVANLLLVQASERRRELAIRVALGATRARLARLLLAEGLALAAAGGCLGWLLALWASGVIVALIGTEVPYWIRFGIDWRVFVFATVVTLLTGLACGLAPALHAARADPQAAMKDGSAGGAGSARTVRLLLASGQLALALVLLAGAGLLIKTVVRSHAVRATYDPARVVVGDVELADARYADDGQVRLFAAEVLDRLDRVAGVRAAVARQVFFAGFGAERRRMEVDGRPDVPDAASPTFYFAVTPAYLEVLGVTLREGRGFTPADRDGVAIVNVALASRLWPEGRAIGKRIRFAGLPDAAWLTIVGVSGDAETSPSGLPARASAYVPFVGSPGRSFALYASTAGDGSALVRDVRTAVAAVDPDQPVEDVMTMADARAVWAAPSRFVGALMASLAGVALLMAAMGTFGVVAFSVSQRTREIGVRLALGATPRQVEGLLVRGGGLLTLAGLGAGLPAAWASTRALQGVLAGTSPTDPAVFAIVSGVLAVVGLAASWLPARRARRVDPLVVLRDA